MCPRVRGGWGVDRREAKLGEEIFGPWTLAPVAGRCAASHALMKLVQRGPTRAGNDLHPHHVREALPRFPCYLRRFICRGELLRREEGLGPDRMGSADQRTPSHVGWRTGVKPFARHVARVKRISDARERAHCVDEAPSSKQGAHLSCYVMLPCPKLDSP